MNRAERRRGQREGWACEHGYPKKTDGRGYPACPHRCGFDGLQQHPDGVDSAHGTGQKLSSAGHPSIAETQ